MESESDSHHTCTYEKALWRARVHTHVHQARPSYDKLYRKLGIEKNEAGEEFPAPSECIWHVLHTGVTWSHRSGSLRSRRIV